jgi:hypothetical protein
LAFHPVINPAKESVDQKCLWVDSNVFSPECLIYILADNSTPASPLPLLRQREAQGGGRV